MDIGTFFSLLGKYPWAIVAILLTYGLVFINGWTDGPNAIATSITTRALKPKHAVALCAIGNLIGVLIIGALASSLTILGSVSNTIAELIKFPAFSNESELNQAFIVIAGGIFAVNIFSLASTYFGFPSSQSNGLIGGLTGAAIALGVFSSTSNVFSYVSLEPWIKVIIGFFGSLVLGFILGYVLTKLIALIFRRVRRRKANNFFDKGQIVSAGLMSFAHGVQDGSKTIGVSMMIASLLTSFEPTPLTSDKFTGVYYIYLPVALFMTLGTCMGGFSIIKTMGKGMTTLSKYQAFATDIASFIGLMLATFFGLPISTGSIKSTAILGCGASISFRRVKWGKAGKMIGSWILIFPATALVGFIFVAIFIWTVR